MEGHNLVVDRLEALREVQKLRDDRQRLHDLRQQDRSSRNSRLSRTSAGARVKQGDMVLVREADSTFRSDGVNQKLAPEIWTGPWTVTAVITPGLCFRVVLNGRQERVRRAAASHIKPYHVRPPRLRHDFGDEYAHFAWGPDLGLAADSTIASPLYTLVDRFSVGHVNGTSEWKYRRRYLNGSESHWLTESECLNSFTPLQLDVFHALWELYHPPDYRPRPQPKVSRSERFAADPREGLIGSSGGNDVVWREFADQEGRIQRCRTEVYDYKTPYWRVRHGDGDQEELTRTEVERGRSSTPAEEFNRP